METQFRVTSAEPCSGAMLRAFRKRFRIAFGRDSEIQPEREFLQAAEMCWADRPAASVRLRTLWETIESEGSASKEHVQDGLTAWMELCNATAALLDSAPELPPERFNEILADLGAAIGAEYGEEGFRHLVWDAIVSAMDRFLDENRLAIMDKDRDEKLARRVDVFFPESDKPLSQEILGLLAFRVLKQDRSMISLTADEIFAWLMTFSRDMNYVRQKRLLIRARMGKSKKGLCLCGSGLKYKVCCFL